MKNSTEAFADEALRFERWLLEGSDRGADAAMEALRHLLALYGAALNLPTGWSEPGDPVVEVTPPGEAEWQRAYEAARRLPIDLYGQVFNPAVVPPEEPCVGSIADDLADIYRDIAGGLRVFEQGSHAVAAAEWTLSLYSHWGAHATGAIHALHWWLARNRQALE